MKYELVPKSLWNPAREISPWFKDFDSLFDGFFGQDQNGKMSSRVFNPACDVEETETQYLMNFDLPGMPKEAVKIEVIGNRLIVSGERKEERKSDKSSRHVTERYYGQFRREFALPTSIDSSKVQASFKDGVLEVVLPKIEASQSHQIKIN
jgi:HSP20 family protein